jgi:diacylglycerol kinase (ATP)
LKACFIYNPCSGPARRHRGLPGRIQAFIAESGFDATVASTGHPRHASELARRAIEAGCGLVVAVGGDGTMNEVAGELIGTDTVLGLVPCGSGNGLGRHLGLTGPGPRAFATLRQGRVRVIDTGTANGRPFINVMGAGFDAELSRRFNELPRRGFWPYVRTTLRAFRAYRPQTLTLRAGDREITAPFLLVTVANSDQYGNNVVIAPGASVDDGLLDLVAIRPVGLPAAVPLVWRLFRRTLDRSPRVLRLRGPRLLICRPAPGVIHTDAEVHETGAEIEVLVRPRSLRILVPPEASG